MRIKLKTNMGYPGTDSAWYEDIPEDVVAEGDLAIQEYLEQAIQFAWEAACDTVSASGEIVKE